MCRLMSFRFGSASVKVLAAAVMIMSVCAGCIVVVDGTRSPGSAYAPSASGGSAPAKEPAPPAGKPAPNPPGAVSPASEWQFADDFDDVTKGGWQNRPIVKDLVDDEGRSTHPMPAASDGRVRGIGSGYNYICPWMVRPADLRGRKLSIVVAGKSGDGLMNQAGVWLLADSWDANLQPAAGYELLIYGEGAKRLSVYQYAQGKSREVARFAVGPAIHAEHEYVIQRDEAGNWSAGMNNEPLPHGDKDPGTPDITFQDATYNAFGFVGIHFNHGQSELDYVRIKAE